MCANFVKVSLNFLLPVKIDTVVAHGWMIGSYRIYGSKAYAFCRVGSAHQRHHVLQVEELSGATRPT